LSVENFNGSGKCSLSGWLHRDLSLRLKSGCAQDDSSDDLSDKNEKFIATKF